MAAFVKGLRSGSDDSSSSPQSRAASPRNPKLPVEALSTSTRAATLKDISDADEATFIQQVQGSAIRELLMLPPNFRNQFQSLMDEQTQAFENRRVQMQRELKRQVARAKREVDESRADSVAMREDMQRLSCEVARLRDERLQSTESFLSPQAATASSSEIVEDELERAHSESCRSLEAPSWALGMPGNEESSDANTNVCRRPTSLLVKWINALLAPDQSPRSSGNLHYAFADGRTLWLVLSRVGATHGVSNAVLRACDSGHRIGRSALMSNLEQAITFIWNRFRPTPSAMVTASQLIEGSPRVNVMRFIDELYSIFVVRPAQAQLVAAARWLNRLLEPYGLRLSESASRPPHDTLGTELRSGVALAIMLHQCLPARQCAEVEGAIFWRPMSEVDRQQLMSAVLAVLDREGLAPCNVGEFMNASPASQMLSPGRVSRSMPTGSASPRPQRDSGVKLKSPAGAIGSPAKFAIPPTVGVSGSAFEDELLAIVLSAAYRRFGAAAHRLREASPGLLIFKEAWRTPAAISPPIQVSPKVKVISPGRPMSVDRGSPRRGQAAAALAGAGLQPESNQRTAALLAEIDSTCSWSSSTL